MEPSGDAHTTGAWAVSMDRNISFRRSRGPSSVLSPYVLSLKPLHGVAISSTIRQRVEPAHQVQGNCRDGWRFRSPIMSGRTMHLLMDAGLRSLPRLSQAHSDPSRQSDTGLQDLLRIRWRQRGYLRDDGDNI